VRAVSNLNANFESFFAQLVDILTGNLKWHAFRSYYGAFQYLANVVVPSFCGGLSFVDNIACSVEVDIVICYFCYICVVKGACLFVRLSVEWVCSFLGTSHL
jgi:hypothetical protein